MVDYTFSSYLGQTITGFNVTSDVLLFPSTSGSASAVTITESGGNTVFTTSAGSVTLSGVTNDKLSSTNVNFANGSRLLVGDVLSTNLLDSLGQAAATYVLSTANDHVLGLGGNDSITSSDATGSDVLQGNAGDDTISIAAAAAGNHTIHGGAGNDLVTVVGAGANVVYGDNGDDQISLSGSGANFLQGNAGADTINVSGSGSNTVRGGQGADTLNVNAAATGANQVWGDAGADTITIAVGANGLNIINAGADNDSVTASGNGNYTINGNAGVDTITLTGTGANTLFGGAGNDTITFSTAATGNNIVYGDLGDDTLTGSFAGAAVNSTIFGGSGTDTIRLTYAAAAHRTIIGDFASTDIMQVTLSGGQTAAGLTVTGVGSSPVVANAANESISFAGFSGNFTSTNFVLSDATQLLTNGSSTSTTLTASTGADQLIAGNGGDVLNGAAGADKMTGGTGTDLFLVALAADHAGGETITGGAGLDIVRFTSTTGSTLTITATTDVERIEAATGTTYSTADFTGTTALNITAAAQVLFGSNTGVYLVGNNGVNTLTASSTGNDTLSGGGGGDTIALGGAGNGNDVVAYLNSADVGAADTVTNFNMTNDQFGFSTTLTGLTAGTLQAASYGEVTVGATAGLDDGLITTALNLLSNVATAKVFVITDSEGGAQALVSADLDLGLKNSNAAGAGFVLALLDDAAATAATLYYDPNFDNNGDIVLIGTVTTAGTNLTLANAEAGDFVII